MTTLFLLLCIVIWFCIGFFGSAWVIAEKTDVTFEDIPFLLINGIGGPVSVFIGWAMYHEDKVIFKKRK